MNEQDPSIESEPMAEVTKEQLIQEYTKLREKYQITNPDDFDLDDPEVQRVHSMFETWIESIDIEAAKIGTSKAELRAELEKTLLYVDAGFDDPTYLEEVAEDFLENTLANAEAVKDEDVSEVIEEIKAAQTTIRERLS